MTDTTKPTSRKKKTAGAFDVRVIIGSLLSIYGLILLVMGLFGDPETEKTGGVNANLWAGLGLLVVGGAFLAWWRLRPLIVGEAEDHTDMEVPPAH